MRNSTDRASTLKFQAAFLHPRYWPVWAGVGLLRLLALLPHRTKLKLGRPLGRLLYHLAGSRRRIAAANIRIAFPDWSEARRQALLKAHFESLGISLMELLIVWWGGHHARRWRSDRERALVTYHGLEHIQRLQAEKRGVILLVPHFTHIDLTGIFIQIHFPIKAVYRPHDDPLMEYLITRGRTIFKDGRLHVEPIPKDNVRAMLKHLKKGGLLFYLPDQRFRNPKARVDASFFGRPAPSNPATSKLARLGRAAVVPVFTRRIGERYHVTFLPPLADFPGESELADTERLHRLYEREIRENPAQYLWVHNRWNLPRSEYEKPA